MNNHVSPSLEVQSDIDNEPTPQLQSTSSEPIQTQYRKSIDGGTQQVTSLREVCADIHGRVDRFLSAEPSNEIMRNTQAQTRVAMSVIAQALQDYGFEALSLSYNGGKDCLVLLILYLSVLHTHFTQPTGRRKPPSAPQHNGVRTPEEPSSATTAAAPSFPTSIPSIYAKPPDPFDSVTVFVESSTQDYRLDLTHISTNPGFKPNVEPPPSTSASNDLDDAPTTVTVNGNAPIGNYNSNPQAKAGPDPSKMVVTFRDAFALYLRTHPQVQAIFVGTRRTDPHGAKLQHFQMTDGNWPRFMRIHPVIDWRLGEIWCFLRSKHLADPKTGKALDYCGMYDAGYTSLGGVGDTLRNPKLKYIDDEGHERYRPAHVMTEDIEERAGRE